MSAPLTNNETFRTIKKKQDDLVLAATDLAAIIFPYGVDPGPIVDDETGNILPLVEGGLPLGEIQKQAGVELAPEMSTEVSRVTVPAHSAASSSPRKASRST